jgi:hypothetical protein
MESEDKKIFDDHKDNTEKILGMYCGRIEDQFIYDYQNK